MDHKEGWAVVYLGIALGVIVDLYGSVRGGRFSLRLKQMSKTAEKPPRFPHRRKMKLKHLFDTERYIVDMSVRYGGGIAIITGQQIKERRFWHERLASYPLVNSMHWSRVIESQTPTNRASSVEVILPRVFRNFKGRRMVIFVRPWTLSRERRRFKKEPEYADQVRKYVM